MERVTLTDTDQRRLLVLNELLGARLTAAQAGDLLGLSVRQVRRVLAAYRRDGAAAIVHGNRGRAPAHVLDRTIREQVIALAQGEYAGCNQHHYTDLLAAREGIVLSRSSVRRILLAAGVHSPRTHRVSEHRARRERYAQEGMLTQLDGSPHAWLEERGPKLCLLAAIDDATGTVPAACFRLQEDAQGYLLLLRELIRTHGRPLAFYHDRHTIFVSPKRQPTLEEELAGKQPTTQVSRAFAELGIRSISARSPQAKGRIERLFGTLQDRLVSELRLSGVATIEEANRYLTAFLSRYNAQFAVPAGQPGSAYRRLDPGCDLDAVCSLKYERTVAADNTVKLEEHRIQIGPGFGRTSYAKARVEIQERLDGVLVVMYHGRTLGTTKAPLEAPVLRARSGKLSSRPHSGAGAAVGGVDRWAGLRDLSQSETEPGRPRVPTPRPQSPDHPWKRSYKTMRVTKSLDY
jgi:transposase